MKRYQFNKLVRNKLPERMIQEGITVSKKTLSTAEYRAELINKIYEEVQEVQECDNREEFVTEIADLLEVIESLLREHNISMEEVKREQQLKKDANGYFSVENYVSYIDVPVENSKLIDYLENRKRPYVYTEE